MPLGRKDEIGELVIAFNNMVQKRFEAEEKLRSMGEELEARVIKRTAELARANEELRTENAERERVEVAWRETEQKFRQLADNITDVFWMTSPDFKTISLRQPGLSTNLGSFERELGRPSGGVVRSDFAGGPGTGVRRLCYASGKRVGSERGIPGSAT